MGIISKCKRASRLNETYDHVLVTNTYSGAADLYHGIPDIKGAVVESVESDDSIGNYTTKVVLRLQNGKRMLLTVSGY